MSAQLARLLRDVPDFPAPGVLFKDIGPVLADAGALRAMSEALASRVSASGATLVAGIESRGFVLGAPAALVAGVGFVPLRKAGRLPGPVSTVAYQLEYGTAELEIQQGVVPAGARVLIVDDVLATGGTAAAAVELISAVGGVAAEVAVLLELITLGGRRRLSDLPVTALLAA